MKPTLFEIYIAILTTLLTSDPVFALNCVPMPLLVFSGQNEAIILGKVIEVASEGTLMVQVVDTLRGNLGNNRIRVDAKDIMYWSFGRISFTKGSEWVFKLYPAKKDKADFELSDCSEPPKVMGEKVTGWFSLDSKLETITIFELKRKMKALANE